jgi:glycosyltransferase involved in cell wall biosynthesis
MKPLLSVIVPVRNGTAHLERTLSALLASNLPREAYELVVVDDDSTDASADLAEKQADYVVRLTTRPHGPSYARNRGAEVSQGDILVFVDADVLVKPGTLSQFLAVFREHPDVCAVFGAYDADPTAPGFVSQYRNLIHHYVHQRNAGEAATFWSGCGAVRKSAFVRAGMFDEWHFGRPQIEDIELGGRLREFGGRILLRPEIQATHLKQWTLGGMLRTDFVDRGVPWMRLLIQRRQALTQGALNVSAWEKVNTALVGAALFFLGAAVVFWEPRWLIGAGVALLPPLALNIPMYLWFARTRGALFALRVIPLHLLCYALNGFAALWGWMLHQLIGEPTPSPVVDAMSEMGIESWPPTPRRPTTDSWADGPPDP